MSVTAPTTGISITDAQREELIECIRMMLRDRAENNILLGRIQFTNAEVDRAIKLATGRYNAMTPLTNVDWTALPEVVLFHGAAYYLMMSESFLQARNQMSVNTDGLGVIGIDDKSQLYQQLAAGLKNDFDNFARSIKTERNMLSTFGCLSSGYAHVSRFHNN